MFLSPFYREIIQLKEQLQRFQHDNRLKEQRIKDLEATKTEKDGATPIKSSKVWVYITQK